MVTRRTFNLFLAALALPFKVQAAEPTPAERLHDMLDGPITTVRPIHWERTRAYETLEGWTGWRFLCAKPAEFLALTNDLILKPRFRIVQFMDTAEMSDAVRSRHHNVVVHHYTGGEYAGRYVIWFRGKR